MAASCELQLGPYCLGQSYAAVSGSLTEVDPAIAATLGPAFEDERIYHGSPVAFAGLEWETTLSITQGRVWKIMLSLGPDWGDWGELGDEFRRVRGMFLREFGEPTEHSVLTDLTGALAWQRPWGGIWLNGRFAGEAQGMCVILTAAEPVREKWDAPTGEGLWFRAKLLMNLVRSVAPFSRQRIVRNVLTWAPEEQQRWTLLRAIEWGKWPLFVAQPIAPLLLLVAPWWTVMAGVVLLSWCWCLVRYRFLSVALVNLGAYAVLLKWPVCIGTGIYLAATGHCWLASLAALWPLATLVLMGATPPTHIGRVQELLMRRLLGTDPRAPEWGAPPRSDETTGAWVEMHAEEATASGWAEAPQARADAPPENPSGAALAEVIEQLASDAGVVWVEVFSGLNPAMDARTTRMLHKFRKRGYQFNPHLGAKVLSAAYAHLASAAVEGAERRQHSDQPGIQVEDVIAEAIRQTDRLGRGQ